MMTSCNSIILLMLLPLFDKVSAASRGNLAPFVPLLRRRPAACRGGVARRKSIALLMLLRLLETGPHSMPTTRSHASHALLNDPRVQLLYPAVRRCGIPLRPLQRMGATRTRSAPPSPLGLGLRA